MIVLLLLVSAIPFSFSSPRSLISFQAHSYNDLRQWPSLLRSSHVDWWKIDPTWMPSAFCTTQTRVVEPTDARGCLVLNHDTPVATRTDYFTLDDVLDLLRSQQPLFPDKVHIALCFKGSLNPCDGSARAQNWTALVDEFVHKANTAPGRDRVEFVLDGIATPSTGRECLRERWRPWNATFIVTHDPADAITSNNASLGYDRFQVNNMPSGSSLDTQKYLVEMRASHYGKFVSSNTYPFLFWEPSAQSQIQAVSQAYAVGEQPVLGLRFAINIDPVQFSVYAASYSNATNNINVHAVPRAAAPHLIITSVTPHLISFLLLFSENTNPNVTLYQPWSVHDGTASSIAPPTALPHRALALTHSPYHAFISATHSASSTLCAYRIHSNSLVDSVCIAQDARSLCSHTNHDMNITLLVGADSFGRLFSVSFDETSHEWHQNDIVHTTTQLVPSSSACVLPSATEALFVIENNSTIMAATLVLPLQPSSSFATPFTAIGVGTQPSLALSPHGDLVLVNANSYCWNTEHRNKRATPALCDSQPVATSSVLTYTTAPNSTILLTHGLASPCDPDALRLHGTYDMGSEPRVAPFVLPSPSDRRLHLLLAHQGRSSADVAASDCGLSLPFDGIVLDSIQL